MYTNYCETRKWKIEVTNLTEGTVGGYKEIVFKVTGNGCLWYFKI